MGNHKNTLRKTGSMPATYTKWSLRALALKLRCGGMGWRFAGRGRRKDVVSW